MALTGNENNANKTEQTAHEAGKGFSGDMRNNVNEAKRDFRATRYQGTPILSKGNAGDGVLRFIGTAKKVMEDNITTIGMNKALTWDALAAASNDTGFILDSGVIIARLGKRTIALTLEFTGGQAMKRATVDIDRNSYQYTTVPADQYSTQFKTNLNNLISSRLPHMVGESVEHIGVLPIFESKLSDEFLFELAQTAISQVYSYAAALTSQDELTIDALELDTHELVANVNFHNGEITNELFDTPERSDIKIDVDLIESDRNRRSSRQATNVLEVRRDLNVTRIAAYVDLFWVGNKTEARQYRFGRREEAFDPHTYGLNLIVTDMQHPSTTGHMVMALAQLPVMINSSVMVNGLRPGGRNQSLRSYQALTWELPQDCIETEIPEILNDKEWESLVDELIYPERQIVTLQIPRAGLSTVSHNALALACDLNNPNRKAWADLIIEAADRLTDNRFSDSFRKDEDIYDIGELTSRPVLLGYWTDEKGSKRDLREIDYYAILSHYGKRDHQMVENWEICINDFNTPIEIRLEKMEEIIADFTGGAYKILDRADNIELNTNGWLYKLTDACRAAGMVVSTEGITQDTSVYRRGYEGRYNSSEYGGSAFSIRRQGGSYSFRR